MSKEDTKTHAVEEKRNEAFVNWTTHNTITFVIIKILVSKYCGQYSLRGHSVIQASSFNAINK